LIPLPPDPKLMTLQAVSVRLQQFPNKSYYTRLHRSRAEKKPPQSVSIRLSSDTRRQLFEYSQLSRMVADKVDGKTRGLHRAIFFIARLIIKDVNRATC
jgi:hypothetical protein